MQVIQKLLATSHAPSPLPLAPAPPAPVSPAPPVERAIDANAAPVVFVVDDDRHVREALRAVLEDAGRVVEDYASCEAFLAAYRPGREECLLIDAYLPGMNGLELLQRLHDTDTMLPAIMITGASDVAIAVQAMKAGACDFIEKPIGRDDLVASVERALAQSHDSSEKSAWRHDAAKRMASLTARQREIVMMVLAGAPSKNIAADLGISQRTVENHRASIMKKTGAKSLPALARLAIAATD
jgi:two-component system CheB/CheR fusion protein